MRQDMMLWETAGKFWVQQLCIILLGVITWFYNRQLRKQKQSAQDQKAVKQAMLAQLRDRFYQSYKQIVRQGYYPIRDREVMEDLYAQYHALGGNGVIDNLKRELDMLPAYQLKEGENGA